MHKRVCLPYLGKGRGSAKLGPRKGVLHDGPTIGISFCFACLPVSVTEGILWHRIFFLFCADPTPAVARESVVDRRGPHGDVTYKQQMGTGDVTRETWSARVHAFFSLSAQGLRDSGRRLADIWMPNGTMRFRYSPLATATTNILAGLRMRKGVMTLLLHFCGLKGINVCSCQDI